jgi:hypothetical protein
MTDELKNELDSAFLDIAKTAARRTLALIDQGQIPGYARVAGRATPKSTALAHEAEVRHLVQSLHACFSGSLTPNPTIEQMADAVRGLPLGERVAQQTDPGPLGGNPDLTIRHMSKELVDWVLESEADDFDNWLGDGNGEPAEGVDEGEWLNKLEERHEGYTPEVWDWLASNTLGHIYCVAWKLNKELNR